MFPAVFFVVGKQAEENPGSDAPRCGTKAMRSATTPGIIRTCSASRPKHQHLELTSTQRVIQAITGHSTTLFRPPYGGDVEPHTGKEVSPDAGRRRHELYYGRREERSAGLAAVRISSRARKRRIRTSPRDYRRHRQQRGRQPGCGQHRPAARCGRRPRSQHDRRRCRRSSRSCARWATRSSAVAELQRHIPQPEADAAGRPAAISYLVGADRMCSRSPICSSAP